MTNAEQMSPSVLDLVTGPIMPFVAAFLGYKLGIKSHIAEKRHDFIERQLSEFYAPLLALRDEIRAATDRVWDIRSDTYDDNYFYEHVWPLYRKLATHFSIHLWLASPQTRVFHRDVSKIIEAFGFEIDNDFITDFDGRVLGYFDKLNPFFDHLEARFDYLQRKLLPDET